MDWQQYNPDENSDHGDHFRNPFDVPGYGDFVRAEEAEKQRAREAELAEMRCHPVEAIGDDPCRHPGCNSKGYVQWSSGEITPCPECGGSTNRAWVSPEVQAGFDVLDRVAELGAAE